MSATTIPNFEMVPTNPAHATASCLLRAQVWMDTYPNEQHGVSKSWCQGQAADQTTERAFRERRLAIATLQSHTERCMVTAQVGQTYAGEIDGYRDETYYMVDALNVAKAYRGKGVGTALMTAFLEWADPKLPVQLTVAPYNRAAISFYERFGFALNPEITVYVGDIAPMVTMYKKGAEEAKV